MSFFASVKVIPTVPCLTGIKKQVIFFLVFGNSVSSTEVPSVTNHFKFNTKVFSSQANWQALEWGSTCTVIDQLINQWEHIYMQKKTLQLTKTVPTLYLLFAQVQQSYYNCTVHVHVAILQRHTQMRESNILPRMYPRVCGGRGAGVPLSRILNSAST